MEHPSQTQSQRHQPSSPLLPGFDHPSQQSQTAFRSIMSALAEPGQALPFATPVTPPMPLTAAAAAVALTLCDHDTPIWLDEKLSQASDVAAWLRFHTGASITTLESAAAFAFISDPERMSPLANFAIGEEDYPDRSTTLVLQVGTFLSSGVRLTGPGIKTSVTFDVTPRAHDFWSQCTDNAALFPLGVDTLFVNAHQIAGLPRSTKISLPET